MIEAGVIKIVVIEAVVIEIIAAEVVAINDCAAMGDVGVVVVDH